MKFLRHPYFDSSDRKEWLDFPLDADGAPSEVRNADPFEDAIRRDFNQITFIVLSRIKACVPAEWLNERPYRILGSLCFCPASENGVRVFLEYRFMPTLTENSPDTDWWWTIAMCPYIKGDPFTGEIAYYIEHFGWASTWLLGQPNERP